MLFLFGITMLIQGKGLRERIKQLRMEHLFEEPCPLYEDVDEEN